MNLKNYLESEHQFESDGIHSEIELLKIATSLMMIATSLMKIVTSLMKIATSLMMIVNSLNQNLIATSLGLMTEDILAP